MPELMSSLQLIGSSLKLIGSLVIAIKGAVDAVKQNKQDCQAIATRVGTLGALLSSLDNNTAVTRHPAVSSALEDLQQALHKALQVIMDCQHESTVSRHANAEKLSKKLRRANKNISEQVTLVTLVACLQSNSALNTTQQEEAAPISSCLKRFNLSELKIATDNFSERNVIGESSSCTVYKGKLPDGSEVAVKLYSKEQHRAFRKQCEIEERFTAKLMHKNIVRLEGHCSTGGQCCLVYEYMDKGSLSAYINGDRRGSKLPWQKRFNIIEGIAGGLDYLHDNCGQRIIHLDLRPSNILLDHGFTPKISDFGISEMLPESANERVVASLMGTCGFQAPEYIHKESFSIKSDVYSYGILLLELITGMICGQEDYIFNPVTNLVWELKQHERLEQCIDERLFVDGVESQIEEIERCIHIALLCVEEDPALRPTMHDVLGMLSNKEVTLPHVQKPAYTVNYAT